MADSGRKGTYMGLDIGRVNTRVSIFGISEGKYRLLGCESAITGFGNGKHMAAGVHQALGKLEQKLDLSFTHPSERETNEFTFVKQMVDQVGLTLSAFPPIKATLFGLTERGSLAAGLALAENLPVSLVGAYGSADLADENTVIEGLLQSRPEIMILTGGTDGGVEAPINRWIEVIRLVCRVLPENARPAVFFAGNPNLESILRRRLEPTCTLFVLPNLQPVTGERDDVPLHGALTRQAISMSMEELTGLRGLTQLAGNLVGTRGFMLDRMVRYISRSKTQRSKSEDGEILAIDLGAGSTMVCAGNKGRSLARRLDARDDAIEDWIGFAEGPVHHWAAAPVSRAEAGAYLANQHFFPELIPQTLTDLALSQSLARLRIRSALSGLPERSDRFAYEPERGLLGHYEPIIASGSMLTDAPTPGQAMLMLLDGLQPWRQTHLILDRYHLLPVLGLLGEAEPLLPVQVLASDAFENLGAVIPVVSDVADGVMVASINVTTASEKSYAVDIPKGALRRLVVPAGEWVTLDLEPIAEADAGSGFGVSHHVRVKGGTLGVVMMRAAGP
ncbi:MAG: glutamate mutase L [Brevefilum sp.]